MEGWLNTITIEQCIRIQPLPIPVKNLWGNRFSEAVCIQHRWYLEEVPAEKWHNRQKMVKLLDTLSEDVLYEYT